LAVTLRRDYTKKPQFARQKRAGPRKSGEQFVTAKFR
jgi:hypothetical protein